MRSRNLLTAFGLIVMAVCVSTGQIPSAGQSGIQGVITISPANPGPTRIGAAASMPLAKLTFAVEKNNNEVASFITDEQGRFRVELPAGHYKISLKGRRSSIGHIGPFEADVEPGKMTNVEWECDSGIR
ncbi:MAG: hypothetical protein ACJ8LL_12955 [Candidatus Udaeobacter sp.]